MGIPGEQLWGKAGWDGAAVLKVFPPLVLSSPQPHHSPPCPILSNTGNIHSGWAGKGDALQQQGALWRHKFYVDLFSCNDMVEVNIAFVLIGVKWVELSWKIATVCNYQIKI